MLDIYLIRHAESQVNAVGNTVGGRATQTPLTEKGKLQAKLLGQRLKREKIMFDAVYASIALRAHETASIVCEQMNYPHQIINEEDIQELNTGDWENKLRSEIYTPEQLRIIRANRLHFKPPNGESLYEVEKRMFEWIDKNIIKAHASPMKIGLFSHSLAIRCFLRVILDANVNVSFNIKVENTSITQLHHDHDGWHIVKINDHAHLQ